MQLYQKTKLFLMKHIFKVVILSSILSIIVFSSAISNPDNKLVPKIIKKYFSTKVLENEGLSLVSKRENIEDKKDIKTKTKEEDVYFDNKNFLNDVINYVEEKYVHEKTRKEILEAAAEGDQRGVAATAGKIKATQDAARTEARDTIAKIQMDLDLQTAKEGNRKGELVSGMKDERAIEKSLEADAMQANADALSAST